jgi:ribosome-associated toxin RatA of RatAB toxin-antitoxin module
MPKVIKSINVKYTAAQMCALVCDIDTYPQFIPACVASKIITHSVISDTQQQVVASLDFVKGPFKVNFTTKNVIDQHQQITINLVTGPFKYLQGKWQFVELDKGCSVNLSLDFKITHRLLAIAMNKALGTAADKLVQSFCKRADLVYGVNRQ